MAISFDIMDKPPVKRGRKKKYATPEEARTAKLAQTKASNKRKKGGMMTTPPPSPRYDVDRAYNIIRRWRRINQQGLNQLIDALGEYPNWDRLERQMEQYLTILPQVRQRQIIMNRILQMYQFAHRDEGETDGEDEEADGYITPDGAGLVENHITMLPRHSTGGAVWRGATDPIFLKHYLQLKKEAEKNGAGIFDYVKGFYDYSKKQMDTKRKNTRDFIMNPIKTTKRIAGETKDYVKAIVYGASKLPPKVREILHQYGDKKITEINVCRTPLSSLLTGALNAVSLGAFKKAFGKKDYDQLYHLYMWIKVQGQNIILEKNESISMDIDASVRNGSDTMKVSLPTDRTLTLNELMANTEPYMKQKFLTYSAKDNNCQDWVMAVLKSNGLGDDAIYSFVKQDTKSLFANDNFLRKVSNTLTDGAGRANTAIFGAGTEEDDIDFDNLDWGSFTKQFKRFKQQNKSTTIGDLEQFAKMIIDNPKKYASKTLKRANFYLNVILKKGKGVSGSKIVGAVNDAFKTKPTKKAREQQAFNKAKIAVMREFKEHPTRYTPSADGVPNIKPRQDYDVSGTKGRGLGGNILSNDIVKMPNKWVNFVKAYANDKGINYGEAMRCPRCKALYKKGGGFWGDFAKGFTSVLDVATLPISFVNPAAGLALGGLSAGTKALAGQGVKKGNKRKGQPAGARLAYDDLQGKGIPTNQEAYIADLYDSIQLGANAGKKRSK
tara:strand:+ start:12265 stop:14430 length:2166 start_codon:yes stop_codon:yes gene_type:complete